MLRMNISLTLALGLLSAAAISESTQRKAVFRWDDIKYVYAFGDSYSFVQGTQGLANFSFIGDALDFSFTPGQLLSNRIVSQNTSSEGSNWLEFLTGCFEGLPSVCPRQLWDFAFAGADIDKAILPLHHDFTIPLVDQVQQWATYASNVIPHPDGQTLTTWWIGINDTGDTISNTTIKDFTAFWNLEMTSYFDAVQTAFDHGLHTHLFLNVPPGDRAPGALGSASKAALLKGHIQLFNDVLGEHIASFSAANPGKLNRPQVHADLTHLTPGATVLTFDAHAWFNTVLDSPAKFGFTNVTGFCTCLKPGFFWYNSGHPTELVHQLLAEAIRAQLES